MIAIPQPSMSDVTVSDELPPGMSALCFNCGEVIYDGDTDVDCHGDIYCSHDCHAAMERHLMRRCPGTTS